MVPVCSLDPAAQMNCGGLTVNKGGSSRQGNTSSLSTGSAGGVLLQVTLTGKHLQLLDCPTNLPIREGSGGGASVAPQAQPVKLVPFYHEVIILASMSLYC